MIRGHAARSQLLTACAHAEQTQADEPMPLDLFLLVQFKYKKAQKCKPRLQYLMPHDEAVLSTVMWVSVMCVWALNTGIMVLSLIVGHAQIRR